MKMLGLGDDAFARLPALDPEDEQRIMAALEGQPSAALEDRAARFFGPMAHPICRRSSSRWPSGSSNPMRWRPSGVPHITAAESDLASSNAKDLYDALACPKTFIEFSDADGAGMHCEGLNRSMTNRLIIDWLDDRLDVHH